MRIRLLIFYALLVVASSAAAESLRIVSYNVENLFYPEKDSLNDDGEWTPEGARNWSFTRYYRKEENIARVLTNIGEWSGVDVIGLCEVENAMVVKRLCYTMRRGEYDFVHYDSPDRRGIDVALIYKKARIDTLQTRVIPVCLGLETTRDILYVHCVADKRDTLHLFVCHMPSQRGGAAESAWKREAAKNALQHAVDEVLDEEPNARIIVMGDMNCAPIDDIRGLRNRMTGNDIPARCQGTHKYQGHWMFLDQFYTSPAIDSISTVRVYDAEWIQEPDEKYLGLKPKRTYDGYRYQNGYSDHLPIVLMLKR